MKKEVLKKYFMDNFDFFKSVFLGFVCFSTTFWALKELISKNILVYIFGCGILFFFSILFNFKKEHIFVELTISKFISIILLAIACICVTVSN